MRHKWANRRNKLHGLIALDRVLGSPTLRRLARRALTDAELRQELQRRERLTERDEQRQRQEQRRPVVALLNTLLAWWERA